MKRFEESARESQPYRKLSIGNNGLLQRRKERDRLTRPKRKQASFQTTIRGTFCWLNKTPKEEESPAYGVLAVEREEEFEVCRKSFCSG